MPAGIEIRHARACRSRSGGRCNCEPGYQASVFDAEAGRKIRKTFPNLRGAKAWRNDAQSAMRQGTLRASSAAKLEEVTRAWLEGARSGAIRTRSGDPYKPSAVRAYEQTLRLRVLPVLGPSRLSGIRRGDIQDLVDELVAAGMPPATIQATLIPLKAICRREASRGRLAVNPTHGLELPAVRGGRDRIADPVEGAALLAALSDDDRPIWAAAMYAGLRRGELMALRVDRIDLDANVIRVEYGWDAVEGVIDTKGRNRRRVPIIPELRELIVAHLVRSGRRGDDLAFGRSEHTPFDARRLTAHADAAWTTGKLRRITLHECRHTFASLMIAAGVNAKALSTYMGHSSIQVTYDKYGHLMPGNETEAADLLTGYLERARWAAS